MWVVYDYGKWKGKGYSLPQIVLTDPDWFFHCVAHGKIAQPHIAGAKQLAARATAIKLPASRIADHCISHWIGADGKYAGFTIVLKGLPSHLGGSKQILRDNLDLSFPTRWANYDKLGCSLMLGEFKLQWLGRRRVSQDICERFFNNSANMII